MKDNKKQHVVGPMTDLGLTISKSTTHLLIWADALSLNKKMSASVFLER